MSSNSITSQGASTKQPTRLQKQHLAENQSRQVFLPVTNTNPRYATRGQNKPTMALLVQPPGPIRRLLHLTLRSWSLKRTQQ